MPFEVQSATVRHTEADDFTLTIQTVGPEPSSTGYIFFGNNGAWLVSIYQPIVGGWQARLQGDIRGAAPKDHVPLAPGSDLYFGDKKAVSVSGGTITVTWPYGRFDEAKDRSGRRLAIGAWSVLSENGSEVCGGGRP